MDDEADDKPPRDWGDLGAIFIAAGCSTFALWLIVDMLLGGHPLAMLFRELPRPAAPALTQAQWNEKKFTTVPGEVVISTSAGLLVPPGDGAFPRIKDWKSLRIGLERSMCFGTCPAYSVEISGDGRVAYKGENCVAQKGPRAARIAVGEVNRLVGKFRDANYFSLRDAHRTAETDLPAQTISIAFDDKAKRVVDYGGEMVGMPKSAADLEDAIDRTAGTDRWVYGGTRHCGSQAVKEPARRGP